MREPPGTLPGRPPRRTPSEDGPISTTHSYLPEYAAGAVLIDPLIAFGDGGFVCPLVPDVPQRDWCVAARDDLGAHHAVLLLVPVSPEPVDDAARPGAMMQTKPVLTRAGKRVWLCTGYPVIRLLDEVVPIYGIPDVVDSVLPVGFDRAVGRYADWRCGVNRSPHAADTPDDRLDWWLVRYLKGRLYDAVCDRTVSPGWWKTVTVGEAVDGLDEYDPPVRPGTSVADARRVVGRIRDMLAAEPVGRRIASLI